MCTHACRYPYIVYCLCVRACIYTNGESVCMCTVSTCILQHADESHATPRKVCAHTLTGVAVVALVIVAEVVSSSIAFSTVDLAVEHAIATCRGSAVFTCTLISNSKQRRTDMNSQTVRVSVSSHLKIKSFDARVSRFFKLLKL